MESSAAKEAQLLRVEVDGRYCSPFDAENGESPLIVGNHRPSIQVFGATLDDGESSLVGIPGEKTSRESVS